METYGSEKMQKKQPNVTETHCEASSKAQSIAGAFGPGFSLFSSQIGLGHNIHMMAIRPSSFKAL